MKLQNIKTMSSKDINKQNIFAVEYNMAPKCLFVAGPTRHEKKVFQ
jgi:hypothetical protein